MPAVEIAAAVAGIVSAVVSVVRIVVEAQKSRKEKQQRRSERQDTSTSFSNTIHTNPSRDNETYTPVLARNEERFEQRDGIDPEPHHSS